MFQLHRRQLIGGAAGVAAISAIGRAEAADLTARDQAAIANLEQRLLGVGGAPGEPLLDRMRSLKVPAVSVAFFEDGQVRWAKAYGLADAATARPATTRTFFQAASMSKPLTAAAALRMVEEGRLSLDEDVNARLREWRIPASSFDGPEKVTLRRLLSHTAGLTVGGYPGYAADKPLPTTVQILSGSPPANTAATRPVAVAGDHFAYNGGGYTVAQLLMSEVAREPFPRLMKRLVLSPCGMRRSTFEQPPPSRFATEAAFAHDREGNPLPGHWHVYPEYAAAGLWTTPTEYADFAIALQNSWAGQRGSLLKAATARLMTKPVVAPYALGLNVRPRGGLQAIEHGGSNEGFSCNFVAHLEGARQGFVFMANSNNASPMLGQVFLTIAEAYGWGSPEGTISPARAPSGA